MKKHLISLLVLFILVSSSLVGVSYQQEAVCTDTSEVLNDGGLMNSSWPMYLHDTRHSGQSPYSPSGNWPIEKWTFKITGFSISSPTIDKNGTIYIGANWEHRLIAINPDGTEKWNATISNTDSTPALGGDGIIYIGDSSGSLNAIYPNGTNKWSIDLGNEIYAAPVIDNNGIIYAAIGGSSDKLCAVYPNGTLRWSFQTAGAMYGAPAIANDGTIYAGSCDGYFYALYPNGTLQWKHYCGDTAYVYGVSLNKNGTIYCSGRNMYLYAFSPNGTVMWTFYLGHPSGEGNLCVAEDGTIYLGAYGLYSISPSGKLNWRFEGAGTVFGAPIVDSKGIIYCASENKHLWAINKNGTLRWNKPISGEGMASSAAIAEDGTIYISGLYPPVGSAPPFVILYSIGSFNDTQPTTPTITGAENGHVRRQYDYTIASTDPDNDNISYYIDWGDGKTIDWIGPFDSGEEIIKSHTWLVRGTYEVKAKARDGHGMESDWGALSVTMPYEPPQFPFIHWLLERFPNAFPILRFLLEFNH